MPSSATPEHCLSTSWRTLSLAATGRGLEGLLDRSYRFGNKPVTMLGAIARHLQKLEVLVAQMEAGSTADQANAGIAPAGFF